MSNWFDGAKIGNFVCEVHAKEDEGRAKEKPNGNLFMEQPPCKDNRGDGIEIDPVGGNDCSEFADDPVPEEIAEHRGNDTQEEEI